MNNGWGRQAAEHFDMCRQARSAGRRRSNSPTVPAVTTAVWQCHSSSGALPAVIQQSSPLQGRGPCRPWWRASVVCWNSSLSSSFLNSPSFTFLHFQWECLVVFFLSSPHFSNLNSLLVSSPRSQTKPEGGGGGGLVHILSSYFVSSLPPWHRGSSLQSIQPFQPGSRRKRMVNPILFRLC